METDRKDLVIIGAGGFGREVKWLIERINETNEGEAEKEKWNLLGFLDDAVPAGTIVEGLPVLGGLGWLEEREDKIHAVCAVGAAKTRKKIIEKVEGAKGGESISFPALCDPSVKHSEDLRLGRGCIVCAGTILTVHVSVKEFCILNLDCTIGHDAVLEPFVTVYPGVHVSGCVQIGSESELGTGSCVIQGIQIGKGVVVGAGAVVIRDLPESCTAVGNPAKPIKYRK